VENPSVQVVIRLRLLVEHGMDNLYGRAKMAAQSLSRRSVVIHTSTIRR
jgi:hypothetical protein